jgi:predicted TIM-barrel fold metal-dependent hydrolase
MKNTMSKISDPIPLLDCHQHLIYPDQLRYSWTDGLPALANRSFTLKEYVSLTEGRGPVRTIFMETAPDDPDGRSEARLAHTLADQPGSIIAGMVLNCRPEDNGDFEAFVESVRHPSLVGFRRILHVVPDEVSQHPNFVPNVARLGEHRLTFDLCVLSRQLPLAASLVDRCPGVQFILDHIGNPGIAKNEWEPWATHLRELAKRPNVACKISGILTNCDQTRMTVAAIRPYVEHVVACFGWDRVVWGSDWPVVNLAADLPTWIDLSRALFKEESTDRQHRVFHTNAERIYLGEDPQGEVNSSRSMI